MPMTTSGAGAPVVSFIIKVTIVDTFTDADNTPIQNHTPDTGPKPTLVSGTGQIQSNALKSETSGTTLVTSYVSNFLSAPQSVLVNVQASGNYLGGMASNIAASGNQGYVSAIVNDGDSKGTCVRVWKLAGTL